MNKLILSTVALSALALPALAADLPSRTMAPMLSAPPALTRLTPEDICGVMYQAHQPRKGVSDA